MSAIGKMLTPTQMKEIKGAEGTQSTLEGGGGGSATSVCWIHTYGSTGAQIDEYGLFCSGSAAANQHCVDLIVTKGTGVYRCTYNCG